jgi:hypothetical protein
MPARNLHSGWLPRCLMHSVSNLDFQPEGAVNDLATSGAGAALESTKKGVSHAAGALHLTICSPLPHSCVLLRATCTVWVRFEWSCCEDAHMGHTKGWWAMGCMGL